MAAKLLHSLTDDNADLQKQIGCMTGIFHLFDRHHILKARRISQQKRLPPGNTHFTDGSQERDSDSLHYRQAAADTSLNKGLIEKQRISTESSRASFSSSCSSSLSSVDCKAQPEASLDGIIFPETTARDPVMNQTSISQHLGRLSLDLRDVVKDSMYREARGLSVKTAAKEEASIYTRKQKDSPRPLQLPDDGSYGIGIEGTQGIPIDLKESLRVLAKLREAPWYYGEARELPRSSYEVRDGQWHSISKDAPRFSYDGREISRLSFESRETIKCPPKLNELPRLSLDGRQSSWRSYSTDSKSTQPSRGFNSGIGTPTSSDKLSSQPQSSATQKRPPSVVAKLMGLEALPDSRLDGHTESGFAEAGSARFPRSSKNGFSRPPRVSNSPKNSIKDPISPRWKNPDLVMKPISSSSFPIEPAPWKRQDGNRSSQKSSFRAIKDPARIADSFPSVYSEIEKRLKHLEFKQSGRDLRALKQILEAMQAKGLLETRQEEQALNIASQRESEPKGTTLIQNSRSMRRHNPQYNKSLSSTTRGSVLATAFESPIVIMKPAKLIEKTGISSSSIIPIGDLSCSNKLQGDGYEDNKKSLTSSRISKDHSPKISRRDAAASSTDKKASTGKTTRSPQSQPKSQQASKENSLSSVKNSGSVSPRLQQKKVELERRSRPPTPPPLDSNKPRRQSSKQATESGSPGGKNRPKSLHLQHSDDQRSEISTESRTLSYQRDEIPMQSDSTTLSDSKIYVEVNSSLQSAEINGSQGPSKDVMKPFVSGLMNKKSSPMLDEDESVAELATDAPEHPSPVSVLDVTVYGDDVTHPIKHIFYAPTANDAQESNGNENEDQWNYTDSVISKSTVSGEINRKKLQSIDHLVQKLRRLNSSHDEAGIDYIALLCENTNSDHRYISEILLASGLLLSDLSSELLTFQLHSSGHPINPELFFVLEQTKARSLLSEEQYVSEKDSKVTQNREKFHRKLLFDAVNEILVVKLALVSTSTEPWLKPERLTKKNLTAQKLLKELCFEIEKIQAKKPECSLEDEEDGLKGILWEDVMHRSESWIDFNGEIPGAVLNIERLIFKDLVDEVLIGEAASLRKKPGTRRKLFPK